MGIYDGFSGSPLVNTEGKVIGVNTSGLSRGGGITIPAQTVNRVVDELLTRGHIARPYIGVGMQPVLLSQQTKTRLNLEGTGGVIILSIEPDGPADRAEIQIGDVFVSIDGNPVSDTGDVQGALGPKQAGQTLNASIVRGGELVQAQIVLGERP